MPTQIGRPSLFRRKHCRLDVRPYFGEISLPMRQFQDAITTRGGGRWHAVNPSVVIDYCSLTVPSPKAEFQLNVWRLGYVSLNACLWLRKPEARRSTVARRAFEIENPEAIDLLAAQLHDWGFTVE